MKETKAEKTISVLSYNRRALESEFAKLVEKVKKMNLPIPTLNYLHSYKTIKRFVVKCDGEESVSQVEIELFRYELDAISTFKFNGWNLIATVYHKDGIIELQNEEYTYPEQYGLKFSKCEHCGHSHSGRIKSFIVQHETGNYKQVGSNCVSDFLGISLSMLTRLQESLCDVTNIKYDEGEEISGGGSNNQTRLDWLEARKVYDYQGVLAISKSIFDQDGKYIKKEYLTQEDRWGKMSPVYDYNGKPMRSNQGAATVDKMELMTVKDDFVYFPLEDTYIKGLNSFLESLVVPKLNKNFWPGDEGYDESLGNEVNGYYYLPTDEEDTESFNYKLQSLVEKTRIRKMDFWIPACAIQAYEKHLEYERKLSAGAHLGYIGTVGQKANIKVTIKDVKSGMSEYGMWFLYIMEDENGNHVNKFGTIGGNYFADKDTVNANTPIIGRQVVACAEIKAHETKNGIKTTMIGRLSKYNVKL